MDTLKTNQENVLELKKNDTCIKMKHWVSSFIVLTTTGPNFLVKLFCNTGVGKCTITCNPGVRIVHERKQFSSHQQNGTLKRNCFIVIISHECTQPNDILYRKRMDCTCSRVRLRTKYLQNPCFLAYLENCTLPAAD